MGPIKIEVEFAESKSSSYARLLSKAAELPTYNKAKRHGTVYHRFSLTRADLREHGNLLYSVTGWKSSRWWINGVEQHRSAYRFILDPEKYLQDMINVGHIGELKDDPSLSPQERNRRNRARKIEAARVGLEEILRGGQPYLESIYYLLCEIVNGEKKHRWAAIGKDNSVLATAATPAEAIARAKELGVPDPIIWFVTAAHRHTDEDLGLKLDMAGNYGLRMRQFCPKCQKELQLFTAMCHHCQHVISPKHIGEGFD